MENKLKTFAKKIEDQTIERLKTENLGCYANLNNAKVTIKKGKKYTKVDVGDSGKYMVDNQGKIFGIKAYGVINKNKNYGTLETIDSYFWGDYIASKI